MMYTPTVDRCSSCKQPLKVEEFHSTYMYMYILFRESLKHWTGLDWTDDMHMCNCTNKHPRWSKDLEEVFDRITHVRSHEVKARTDILKKAWFHVCSLCSHAELRLLTKRPLHCTVQTNCISGF